MYSQCQAIHARSLLPCMDTPAVKFTYDASVSSPYPVLLSALPSNAKEEQRPIEQYDGKTHYTFTFSQPKGIPSYLIALASGLLAFASFKVPSNAKGNWSTGVWAEPSMLADCVYEFEADQPKFVAAVEELIDDYTWGSYSVLVLPPSFPFGGMENPIVTYVTPSFVHPLLSIHPIMTVSPQASGW